LQEQADCVGVEFLNGAARTFSLIFGCDGIHSNVRSRWFGDETAFSHFLQTYGSVTIVPRLLIRQDSVAMYQAAGRSIILCAYHGKTDIITLLSSDRRLEYDHRDREQKLTILSNHLSGSGWRVPELLGEIHQADNLYFDELA
jgi:2-polyprenyl-6-methoxyphenol hydroxylase-like FAD-dependent oxidoreductase